MGEGGRRIEGGDERATPLLRRRPGVLPPVDLRPVVPRPPRGPTIVFRPVCLPDILDIRMRMGKMDAS